MTDGIWVALYADASRVRKVQESFSKGKAIYRFGGKRAGVPPGPMKMTSCLGVSMVNFLSLSMNKIRSGIVGVGHIGKFHSRIYSELATAGETDFTAIYDTNFENAKEVADQYGAQATATLEEFATLVDCASVATPTPFHFDTAQFLLNRGIHLLIEKPITETTEQAQQLVALALEKKLILQVGHVERFNPVMAVLEKHLNHPRFIEAHRLSPYPNRSVEIGVVLDLMIHDLEVILHLIKSPIKSVDAVGIPVLSKREDIANARIRFENGSVANVTASRISPEKMRKLRVFQEDAYLSLDYGEQSGEIFRKDGFQIVREVVPIERDDALTRQLQSFLICAQKGIQPRVSGNQAAAALELAIRITHEIESSPFAESL